MKRVEAKGYSKGFSKGFFEDFFEGFSEDAFKDFFNGSSQGVSEDAFKDFFKGSSQGVSKNFSTFLPDLSSRRGGGASRVGAWLSLFIVFNILLGVMGASSVKFEDDVAGDGFLSYSDFEGDFAGDAAGDIASLSNCFTKE